MQNLWRSTEETVTLNIRMGLHRVCIEELRSPQRLLYTAGVGSKLPLHVGASGKVILAFAVPKERAKLLDALTFAQLTSETITDRERLEEELDRVRERGWAVSLGERLPGATGISVPVRDPSGLVMSLSLLGPRERLGEERLEAVRPEMEAAAAEIQRIAGSGQGGA
jgi:DNA-binding IclR family transcriptional regulator